MEKEKIVEKKYDLCKDFASKVCIDCSFYLCDSCFNFIHEKKVNSEHNSNSIEFYISLSFRCSEHPTLPMNVFCLKEKSKNIYIYINYNLELFCPLCSFNNEHDKTHNLINICNKLSLENNAIPYQESISEFDQIHKRAIDIKGVFEKEIDKLKLSRNKVLTDISSYYEKEHLRLNKEENIKIRIG